MQRQLSFLNTMFPEGSAPAWDALEGEQRAEVLAMLARLIAKMFVASREAPTVAEAEEKDDE